MHAGLRPGQDVTVSEPRNHFALLDAAAYVFLAGGIGITPILAMAREAARRGTRGAGLRRAHPFVDGVHRRTGRADGEVHLVPQDEHGPLDLDAVLAGLEDGTLVYTCGPEPLLAASRSAARRTARLERFAAPVRNAPATTARSRSCAPAPA